MASGSTSSPYTLTHWISSSRVGPPRAGSVCAPSAVDSRWCAAVAHCAACALVVNMAVISCLAYTSCLAVWCPITPAPPVDAGLLLSCGACPSLTNDKLVQPPKQPHKQIQRDRAASSPGVACRDAACYDSAKQGRMY